MKRFSVERRCIGAAIAAGLSLLLFAGALSCAAATLALQEGVGGYSGCSDSTIHGGGFDDAAANFGLSPQLLVCSEHFGID